MRKFLILLVFTTFYLSQAFADPSDSTSKGSGQKLPDMVLKDINNNNVNINSFGATGKITIISFWATWCKPCLKELKNLNELMDEWTEKYNVQLVAVSMDDARNSIKVKPTVTGNGWDFEVLLDPNGDLQRAMNVPNPPMTFLLDQKGNIVYTHSGYLEGDEYDLEKEIQKLKK